MVLAASDLHSGIYMKFTFLLILMLATTSNAWAVSTENWKNISELSEHWAMGRFFSPDVSCNSKGWDEAFSAAANDIAQRNISLADAKRMLVQSAGLAFIRPVQSRFLYGQIDPATSQNSLSNISNIGIARVNQALSADEHTIWDSFSAHKIIVLDLRSDSDRGIKDLAGRSQIFEDPNATKIFSGLFENLPPVETVLYNGFPSEGTFSSGYFYSSLTQSMADQERQIARIKSDSAIEKIVVLANENTQLPRMIMAARLSGKAIFLSPDKDLFYGGLPTYQSQSGPEEYLLFLGRFYGKDLRKALRTDHVIDNECASNDQCLVEVIKSLDLKKQLNFNSDKPCNLSYPSDDSFEVDIDFPPSGKRLLAASKAYHTLKLFHPVPELLGRNFHGRFLILLEAAAKANSSLEYNEAFVEFLNAVEDPHIDILSPVYFKSVGLGDLPVRTIDDGKKIYIGCTSKLSPGINSGDEILSVDNESVLSKISKINLAEPEENRHRNFSKDATRIFRGPPNSPITLRIKTKYGKEQTVSLQRLPLNTEKCSLPDQHHRSLGFKWIKPKLAYINLQLISPHEIEKNVDELSLAKWIIVDARGYPQGGGWTLVSHLSQIKRIRGPKFITPILSGRKFGEYQYEELRTISEKYQWMMSGFDPEITGEIVVLVDENTSSQAEHSVLLLQSAARKSTIIGRRTAGALGDVTRIQLPGNIAIQFTGQIVEDTNGKVILGAGIEPQITVQKKIKEILSGKDSILDEAIKFVNR